MERLPYIDTHSTEVAAAPAETWRALLSVLRGGLGSEAPAPLVHILGLEPASASGDWSASPVPGDALPGFTVREVRDRELLSFAGRHRFSRYALVFELEESVAGSRLSAVTYAAFPGILGRIYRAVVIGSRGHRVLTRRILNRVAERA